MIRAARHITRVWRDEAGTVLVELAVVLGLFVLMVFGVIDFGRLGFSYVLAEKATETAARMAVVRPASMLFEISGVSESLAKEALALAAAKLPIKTRLIKR